MIEYLNGEVLEGIVKHEGPSRRIFTQFCAVVAVTLGAACERRPHFDSGRFAQEFGDSGHSSGWYLYKLGRNGLSCMSCYMVSTRINSWPAILRITSM